MDEDQEQCLSRARREHGEVVVAAVVRDGPNRGATYMSIAPRDEFMAAIAEWRGTPRAERRKLAVSVALAVRAAIMRPTDSYTPAADPSLMADLVWMLAIRLVTGPGVADDAGLFHIGLAIEPDESLPWHQRGLLDPAAEAELGIDPRPSSFGGGKPAAGGDPPARQTAPDGIRYN